MIIKCVISYDGSKFYGFQRQTEDGGNRHVTVESRFEEALKAVGINAKILGAGRTDRGVHGSGQVISFEAPFFWQDLVKMKNHLGDKLKPYIYIRSLQIANDNFHPRYDAKRRVYRYLISKREYSPFSADYVLFKKLDLEKVNEAMNCFIGKHDFEFFRKTGSDENGTEREIFKAFAYKHKDLTVLYFEGDGFLRSQIRLMTAAILEYEAGNITLEDLKKQLGKKEKIVRKPAPHTGLYLAKILY